MFNKQGKFGRSFKRVTALLLVTAATLALAACGKSSNSGKTQQVLKLSTPSELATLDNSKASESVSLTQLYHTGEGLYRLGKNSKIENALATSTKVSKDGLQYTFKLRTNDKWSNGKPVTAKDFVYSWRRTADPKTASEYSYLFEGIKNFDEIQKKQLSPDKLGVKAIGNNKLVVTLSKPVPYFKLLVAFPVFFPEQASVVNKYGNDYGTSSSKTSYNGPFKLVGWNGINETWKLVKNPNYWDKKNVHLKQIDLNVVKSPATGLNLYQQGKLDAVTLSGTQVANYRKNKDFKNFVGGSMIYLQLNQRRVRALRNLKVRQALSQIVDKQALATKVLRDGSTKPLGFVSQNLFRNPKTKADFAKDAYVKSGVAYDPTNAKKLWQQGMKAVGQNKLHLTILSDDTDQTRSAAEYLQSQFEKLPGLSISIQTVPKLTRMSRSEKGNFDVVISTWGADFADPINFLSLMTKGNSSNNGGFVNTKYDQLIAKSGSADANDPQKRYNDMVSAEKVLMQQQGLIPLYQPATAQLWKSDVKGYVWNPAGMSQGWKDVSIK